MSEAATARAEAQASKLRVGALAREKFARAMAGPLGKPAAPKGEAKGGEKAVLLSHAQRCLSGWDATRPERAVDPVARACAERHAWGEPRRDPKLAKRPEAQRLHGPRGILAPARPDSSPERVVHWPDADYEPTTLEDLGHFPTLWMALEADVVAIPCESRSQQLSAQQAEMVRLQALIEAAEAGLAAMAANTAASRAALAEVAILLGDGSYR